MATENNEDLTADTQEPMNQESFSTPTPEVPTTEVTPSQIPPEGVNTTTGQPQPGIPQPGMPQPGIPQPGIPQPGPAQPGIPQSGMPQPPVAPMGAPTGIPQPPTAYGQQAYPYAPGSPGAPGAPMGPPPKKKKKWPIFVIGGVVLALLAGAGVFFGLVRPYQMAMEEAKEDFNYFAAQLDTNQKKLQTELTSAKEILETTVATDYVVEADYDRLTEAVATAESLNFVVPEMEKKLADLEEQVIEIQEASEATEEATKKIRNVSSTLKLVDTFLDEVVAEMNRLAPIEFTEGIRFDSAEKREGRVVRLNYTLTKYRASQFTPATINMFRDALKADVSKEIKENNMFAGLVKVNATIEYRCVGSDGKEFFTFTVDTSG
ncbi:MAG: hypothetical protein FWG08_04320 [Propionibacteriaceae bacterium]|nr:hypothetical protein [Propionibacteriaceae bacterium]